MTQIISRTVRSDQEALTWANAAAGLGWRVVGVWSYGASLLNVWAEAPSDADPDSWDAAATRPFTIARTGCETLAPVETELTDLQRAEREALTDAPDRRSVLVVVSGLRRYRAAVARLLGDRYSDGECDTDALNRLAAETREIEDQS
jgi:hypothetical protein